MDIYYIMKTKLNKDRLYYSISDVSKILKLKPSIIRFWEKEFIGLIPIRKQKNSKRKYKINDIQYIYAVKNLLYNKKYTIKGAIKQLEKWKPELSAEKFCELFKENKIKTIDKDKIFNIENPLISGNPESKKSKITSSEVIFSQAQLKISEIKQLLKRLK